MHIFFLGKPIKQKGWDVSNPQPLNKINVMPWCCLCMSQIPTKCKETRPKFWHDGYDQWPANWANQAKNKRQKMPVASGRVWRPYFQLYLWASSGHVICWKLMLQGSLDFCRSNEWVWSCRNFEPKSTHWISPHVTFIIRCRIRVVVVAIR